MVDDWLEKNLQRDKIKQIPFLRCGRALSSMPFGHLKQ